MNRKYSEKLNQLFQEWQSFPENRCIEGLVSFGAEHGELTDEERQSLLYLILSDLYVARYLAGMRMNVHQFLKNFLALKESISLDFDKRELARQCLWAWFVRVKDAEFPAPLNRAFQEWHSFAGEQNQKGLASFLSEHSEITEADRRTLLHVILSERYGLDYLSGRRMSVSQYLNDLASSEESSALDPDAEELTRQCLAVYLHVTKKAPNLESLCEKYPREAEYLQRFWQENHVWLDVLPAPLAEPILPSNRKEVISETYRVPDPPIGHGGQKIVYKIMQESTRQTLALKVPSRKGKASDLIKEAKIQASLSHQGIPAVFSLSSGADTPTRLVERYIVGEAWSEILPQLTLEENLDILERTSRILASAHLEHHIIHGDLKPQNVKVNRQYNEVYLVDWGLAIHLDEIPSRAANASGENDGKLVFRGSVDYLPPEVANNQTEKICLSTDVFMLGATLYQILAGTPPYAAITSSLVAICYAQAGQWPKLPESGPYGPIPQELRDIAEKAMSLEPSARYTDAGEFADALVKYQRRAKLLERYQKAREYNETLREKYEIRNLDHSDRAHLLADTIGNVNDLMHIRQDLAETEKDSAEKSVLFREVFESEFNARKILLSQTIALKDFAQASIQLETGLQSCADYRDQLQTEPEEMTHFLEQSSRDLTRGLAAQWRDRLMKWVALGAICFAVFCVILNLSLWVRSEQKDKIHAMNEAKLEHHLFLTEKDRVQFEKKVFPLSIDYSYMEAFAEPLIAHDRGKKCIIIAAMPKNYSELENKPWQKKEAVKRDLEALGWTCDGKMYTIENWTRPLVTDLIRPDGKDIPGTNVYIDVVSQLSAVKKVLDYLTQDNDFHSIEEREALAHEYVNEFKVTLKKLLEEKESVKDCSWDIKYVTDKTELKAVLDEIVQFQPSSEKPEKME